MARLPQHFNIGKRKNLTTEDLLLIIERMYEDLAMQINNKPDLYIRTADGDPTSSILSMGSINVNTSTNKVEMITQHPTASTVTWTKLSP
jgi:hypothetical protein